MSADFWAGYVSGAASILIGNPLDLIKVRVQAGAAKASAPTANSSSSATRTLFQRTAALATGSAAPVLGYGALNALLFVSYRQAESFLSPPSSLDGPASSPSPPTAGVTWIAGAVAGLATWIVSAPTELIKCRAQLAAANPSAHALPLPSTPSAQAGASSSPSSLKIARQVWRAEGVRGFFLGGTVTALRDSIGYGFYFWSYLLATDAWKQWSADGSSPPSAASTLMCGGLAGIVTWASVFPLDVIKTRVQAQVLLSLKPTPQDEPLLGASRTGYDAGRLHSAGRLSTLEITRLTYREGGFGVFFRGLGVCSARAFVVNAVQWAVYEWIMRELRESGHR